MACNSRTRSWNRWLGYLVSRITRLYLSWRHGYRRTKLWKISVRRLNYIFSPIQFNWLPEQLAVRLLLDEWTYPLDDGEGSRKHSQTLWLSTLSKGQPPQIAASTTWTSKWLSQKIEDVPYQLEHYAVFSSVPKSLNQNGKTRRSTRFLCILCA